MMRHSRQVEYLKKMTCADNAVKRFVKNEKKKGYMEQEILKHFCGKEQGYTMSKVK